MNLQTRVPVSLSIIGLRSSHVPYNLYETYENLRLKIFSETGIYGSFYDTWHSILVIFLK